MADYTLTTPTGFFNATIAPVFNDNIFSEDNLSSEIQKPDLTPVTTIRNQIDAAANDEDLSTTEFDAAADLARQKLISDITSADVYTRGKRDLEFNISAERDVQFEQGKQLLQDLDTYIESSRATVVQRDYEKELERQEEALKDQQKYELQLMALKLGVDPSDMSRKDLRTAIAQATASQYQDALSLDTLRASGSGSGSSTKCPTGQVYNELLGSCVNNTSTNDIYTLASYISKQLQGQKVNSSGQPISSIYGDSAYKVGTPELQKAIADTLWEQYGIPTGANTVGNTASWIYAGLDSPRNSNNNGNDSVFCQMYPNDPSCQSNQ